MMRWLGVVVVSTGLALIACGSSEKKKNPDGSTFTAAPDAQALVGTWSDGSRTVAFDAGGSYRWEEARPCGAPPCPATATSGTWQLRNGKIYLDPQEGGDEIVEFTFAEMQKTVSLSSKKQGSTWVLKKR